MATILDDSAQPETTPRDGVPRRTPPPLNLRRRINRVLPRSLLGRSVMILVTPLILLQVVATWVFYDSFWDKITRRLAGAVAGDIAAVVELMESVPADTKFITCGVDVQKGVNLALDKINASLR